MARVPVLLALLGFSWSQILWELENCSVSFFTLQSKGLCKDLCFIALLYTHTQKHW